MAKSVLIVEKDVALMSNVREALAAKGFGVESTTDGKSAPELIRKMRPDLVVLAVDLDAGQNGYILCRKLKNDDELKAVPVIIIGDPRGFAKHQSLATRADDYVGKPFQCEVLVDRVGGILGFDPVGQSHDSGAVSLGDEGAFSLTGSGGGAADGDVELMDSNVADADAAAGDGSFDDDALREEIPLGTGFEQDEPAPAEKTVTGFVPLTQPVQGKSPAAQPPPASPSRPEREARPKAPPPSAAPAAAAPHGDPHELRDLRTKVSELTASLSDATQRSNELEGRVRELEASLESATAAAEAAKSSAASGGKADKEVITLKENLTKKDRELLKLRTDLNNREKELNEKEQVVIELHEKENSLEQRLSETSEQLAARDGQLKASTAKAEQLATDKRKVEQQLGTARDELRATSAKLTTLEGEHEQLQSRLGELEGELDATRSAKAELEAAKDQLENSLRDTRAELEELRARHDEKAGELDGARRQLEETRGQLEQTSRELDSTRDALQRAADEREEARQRGSELESELKAERDRVHRSSTRARNQHAAMERARKALEQAVHELQDGAAPVHD